MKKILIIGIILLLTFLVILKLSKSSNNEFIKMNNKEITDTIKDINIDPVNHASLILAWEDKVIYADPVNEGGKDLFASKPDADFILVTDIHQDHLDAETLEEVVREKTVIVVPKAVADQLPENLKSKTTILNNGDEKEFGGFSIEAVPMYNLPGPSANYHTKGRGNGYVIERGGLRVYISGDTAGIPEMRSLKNIYIAFICMNLPYTMSPEEAADAVLEFKPKVVYPYHYRQNPTKNFADVAKFKEIINSNNTNIEVRQLDWYANT